MRAVAVLVALLVGPGATPAVAADAQVHFDRAREAFTRGLYQQALAEYDAVLELTGEDAAVRHNKALVYLAMKDSARAADEARRAVDLAPREGRYRITQAVAMLSMDPADWKGAEGALHAAEKLLKRVRDHVGLASAYDNLGFIAQHARDYPAARRWYTLALRHNPDDEKAREALDALGRQGPTMD